MRALFVLGLAAVSSLFGLACSSEEREAQKCRITGPFGSGRGQVWLLRPSTAPSSVVLFAHGWTAVRPTDWHRPRFDHLCSRGSVVVFPRYQVDEFDTFERGVDGFREGVRTAFARLGDADVPVVAVGYSFGGALVNYYAGHAARWNVPVPRGVYSIFPTTRVAGRPAGEPPSSVDFTLLAGDRDEVVGTAGAEDFLAWLKGHRVERRTYRVVRSTGALIASHEAPKETTAASTQAFWAPIDELVTAAEESG
jgi:alpha-beta hydrolase superfamily lysophospholipase